MSDVIDSTRFSPGRADRDLCNMAYQATDMAEIVHDLDRQITSARILVMTGIALGIALGVVLAMILADYVFPAIVAAQLAAGS